MKHPPDSATWRRSGRLIRAAAIVAALAWSLVPIYWMLATSLKTEIEATRLDPTLWPHAPTLAN
jgi:ABC-type glycerol-3-phosphate transport system permease component